MVKRELSREDWLCAARRALLRGGVEAVRVAKLARDLRVTKGSFYWHFRDRDELLRLLLAEWEDEMAAIVEQLHGAGEAMPALMENLVERARLSEEGRVPSDAAIFAWAAVSPAVARRVNRAEERRIELLARLIGGDDDDRGCVEVLYLAWLGFVARGQRVPAFRRRFPEIARALASLMTRTPHAPHPPHPPEVATAPPSGRRARRAGKAAARPRRRSSKEQP